MDNNQEDFLLRAYRNLFQWRDPFRNVTEGAYQGCILANLLTIFITISSNNPDSATILKMILLGTFAGAAVGLVVKHYQLPRP